MPAILTALDGQGMAADAAAWAMVADAAGVALTLPGQTPASLADLRDLRACCRRAAGLPSTISSRETRR